ncbi:nuclear transport factor 2 family protein [Algoriphagus lutimaris]|uniref:ATP-binding protein n=1 Tax=Algoriphagus lutimaris TaxID=613197 RepID=UPI00196B77A4|nr:ATP-binding protein [Algoriphagus lutimaris]MBN3519581.1 nuclear transport factor 2 family protein [Algoriphagus lutimaris]
MSLDKDYLLQKSKEEILKIFTSEYPLEKIPEFIAEEVSGFGTTQDERAHNFQEFMKILVLQYQQSQEMGIEVSFVEKPFHQWQNLSKDLALLVQEFDLSIKSKVGVNTIDFRLSSLFEWKQDSWKLIHWHGSTPVNVEKDAWHVTEWQKKNDELKQKVEEQTQNLMLKNEQLQKAKEQIEDTLKELKETQDLLIQSEKMASLGELTAGIAHEIQNPLNFVNNFSELSNELLEEIQEEIENKDFDEVKAICQDLKGNLEKINHHGKRADSIVKGMLQHSRASTGQKEWTDLNGLADEYLRLAYHGLRAKDKSFNSELKMDLDPNLPKVEIIAQDFGRVLLNMINNSFYSVNEKKQQLGESFQPVVSVSTKLLDGQIQLKISDNGNGIPEEIRHKIFQPFFTTKETGQGTGLGLSLSYDIIKAHGGTIKVESKIGEGTSILIEISQKKE